jgi:hypothetical protein
MRGLIRSETFGTYNGSSGTPLASGFAAPFGNKLSSNISCNRAEKGLANGDDVCYTVPVAR